MHLPRLKKQIIAKGVKWKFITALAPWQGGMWERLIRSTKHCLIKVIGRSLLTSVELNTLLVEVECIINSRPLTYIYDDQDGVSYPLTPSQLINGRNLSLLPNDYHYEIVSTHESLSKRAKYSARVLNQFIARWRKEYRTSLLEAYRPKNSLKESNINVGDIVILSDSSKKRSFWKFCKIVEVYKGQDGAIRSAKIEVGSADNGKKVLIRPVKLLVPLEVPIKSCISPRNVAGHVPQASVHKLQSASPHSETQSNTQGTTRARRNAAVIGEMLRRDKV